MPIYDHNGTTNSEIGKIYDYDGTTNSQIGKIYDYDGTTERLIYTAETQIYPGASVTTRINWGSNTISGFTATKAGYTESYVMLHISVDLTNLTTLISSSLRSTVLIWSRRNTRLRA